MEEQHASTGGSAKRPSRNAGLKVITILSSMLGVSGLGIGFMQPFSREQDDIRIAVKSNSDTNAHMRESVASIVETVTGLRNEVIGLEKALNERARLRELLFVETTRLKERAEEESTRLQELTDTEKSRLYELRMSDLDVEIKRLRIRLDAIWPHVFKPFPHAHTGTDVTPTVLE